MSDGTSTLTAELIVDGAVARNPAISPDGRWVAYAVAPFGVTEPQLGTLWVVVYPREGHGVAERNHQLDLLDRARAWFARWLGDPAAGLDAPGENVARGGRRPAEQGGEVLAEP